jgi:hypothetical protein
MKVKKDRNYEFYITQSWYNYIKKRKMHSDGRYEYMSHCNHWHKNSMLSAVFVIQTDGTPLVFHSPLQNSLLFPIVPESESYNAHNLTTMAFNTKPNTLYLFPSTLSHSVPNNESDIDRIALAFNTFIKGYCGNNFKMTGLVLK